MDTDGKRLTYGPDCFRFCVDDGEKDISGRIYTPLSKMALEVASVGELLLKMDHLFNENGYPQSFQERRTFGEKQETGNRYRGIPAKQLGYDEIAGQVGSLITVDIVVYSRRNATWQGRVSLCGTRQDRNFEGEVELLKTLQGWLDSRLDDKEK